jgi:cytochrome c oxidase subunit 6b
MVEGEVATQTKPPLSGTVRFNKRFPNTNQTKHCWAAYVEFQRCKNKAEELGNEEMAATVCSQIEATYKYLCPTPWVAFLSL